MNDLIYASVNSIATEIKQKNVSCLEVTEMHLKRIEAVNPVLNAVVQICSERAIAEAKAADKKISNQEKIGPLHGVPMTLKDSLDTEEVISTSGTKGRVNFIPENDATVTSRLRKAGAILLGKTNTPEFTLAGETDNLVYGRTNNPYGLDRTPGGSSGGAGAIIASGGSPLDLGTDTGGSVRVPAGFCGIAGLKPTSGRVPRTGHIISHSLGATDALTTVGPMARYVEDLILVYPIIAGPDGEDPAIVPMPVDDPANIDLKSLRVAWFTDVGDVTSTAEIASATQSAADALTDAGASLTEDMPSAILRATGTSLLTADGGAGVRRILDKAGTTEMHPWVGRFVEGTDPLPVGEYSALLEEIDAFRSNMLGFMENYDAILLPVRPFPAPPHGKSMTPEFSPGNTFTSSFNTTGWPGAVVRAGTSPEGLPIGVQFIARPWHEDVSLALAAVVESALGGWQMPSI